jgi:hypothetical protein
MKLFGNFLSKLAIFMAKLYQALKDSIFNSCEAFIIAKECNSLLSTILSTTGIKEAEFNIKVPYVA